MSTIALAIGVLIGNWLAYRNRLGLSPMPQLPANSLRRTLPRPMESERLPNVKA